MLLAPPTVMAVGAADRDVVADEVHAVDGHVIAGGETLEVEVRHQAAVRACRFEAQVRVADRQHLAGIPVLDAGHLAAVDVGLRAQQDADFARLHGDRRGSLRCAAVAVADVRGIDEAAVGVQHQFAV
jgi:hypothetical protein